jgi:hypothetical protein
MTRFTYQHILQLVEGDHELIVRLVEEGIVEQHGDVVTADVDHVLLVRTLWRELDVDWPGIEVALRLSEQLRAARRRIATLEAELSSRTSG